MPYALHALTCRTRIVHQSRKGLIVPISYRSTRGQSPEVDFTTALFAGLAPDGGLYVPAAWPTRTRDAWRALRGLDYPALAAEVLYPFVAGSLPRATFEDMTARAYSSFRHPAVVPLKQLGANEWLMELFHGPTLAFKDLAMQLLGLLFEHYLAQRRQRITVVGATSGDTGSAAIHALSGRANIAVIILHPHERTSTVQRRQMTTVDAPNVHNIAVRGTFDDCQALVKAMFADRAFAERVHLAAVNSINWARVMAQCVYYVHASLLTGGPDGPAPIFAVPTGNFGDVFAGYVAKRIGLPIERLLVATNRNDILARFFHSGEYRAATVVPTISPSMDIQVASNFERLLFDLMQQDGGQTADLMTQFKRTGGFALGSNRLALAARDFAAHRVDEAETAATIERVLAETGELLCPHSAVGVAAARALAKDHGGHPLITLATAHPAKFPEAVEQACGIKAPLPAHMADLYQRPERFDILDNDLATIQAAIQQTSEVLHDRSADAAA